jgi:putative tricarboxylic transport membrane protein
MAKAGRAGAALATAAIGSFVAGAIATGLLALGAPAIAELGLRLQPNDFFALMVLAFGTVSAVMGQSIVRGLIALLMGLGIGIMGQDTGSGIQRLTFGSVDLFEGVSSVTVIVALFALGEALYVAFKGHLVNAEINTFKGAAVMTKEDWKRSWKPWLRGTAIGFPSGVLPSGGSELPTLLSYSLEKKLAGKNSQFGKGAIEGVAGPEAANNANAAGALVPLLALGLPTSATAAVLLSAFQQFNIQAGPLLFVNNSSLVWTLIGALFIGNLLLLIINLPLVKVWVKLLEIPGPYLYAGILLFAMVGAYAIDMSITSLLFTVGVGVLGMLFRRYGYPITPLVLGVILGPEAELQLRRAYQISQGEPMTLVSTSFSVVIYVALLLAIVVPKAWPLIKKSKSKN